MSAEGPSTPRRSWWLVLCYAAFLGLIPLLLGRRNPEVRWHARNGLALFAALAGFGVAATLVGVAVPSLSCVYAVTMSIASLLYVLIAVLATVKALGGQRLVIPGISAYADRPGR